MSDYQGRCPGGDGARITDITRRPPTYADDVPLVAMPTSYGPWTYNAGTQMAVDVPAPTVAAEANVAARATAATLLADPTASPKLLRAAALVLLDEANNLRQWLAAFKTQVAAATNLANLQTRVAALPAMPDRTAVQMRNAILGKISDGSADS